MISDERVEDLTQGKDYTVNDRQVTLAAPTGLKIKIYRVTTTKPLVGWADASVLRAADMTVQSTQLLHLAEETSDLAQDGGLSKDTADNVWDARFNKIKNLLEPTEPGDAVNLSYITKKQTGLLTQLNATGDSQNTRLLKTGDAQNNRLMTTGNSYVNTMTTLKNTATTKATEATNQAALAKKWAVSETSPDGGSASKSSKTWAGEAKTAASNAASSASASASSATASQNSANSAASSASTATQKAMAAATSASNAATSATNAKASETKAASSASAAAASADRAATFDPTSYYKKTETYTRKEVDAKIPTKVSQLQNDSDFIKSSQLIVHHPSFSNTQILSVGGDGVSEVGEHIDMHQKGTNEDFTVRLSCTGGSLNIQTKTGHLAINGSELWIG